MDNLLWVTIDSLRSDLTSLDGSNPGTTPFLERLGNRGHVFEHCHTSGIKTPTAVGSILTGMHPAFHNLEGNPSDPNALVLDRDVMTFPERLREVGYNTGAVSRNAYFSERTGLDAGISEFFWIDNSPIEIVNQLPLSEIPRYVIEAIRTRTRLRKDLTMFSTAPPVTNRAVALLEEFGRSDDPFCVLVHFNETHRPYDPPRKQFDEFLPAQSISTAMRERAAIDDDLYGIVGGGRVDQIDTGLLRSLYMAEIAHVDEYLGRLLAHVDLDETVVVVTGDHGEYLGEYGLLGHQLVARDETTRVPLVLAGIDSRPDTSRMVQHVDVVKTFFDMNDIEFDQLQGINIFERKREACFTQWNAALDLFYERNRSFERDILYDDTVLSVRTPNYRYIEDGTRGDLYRPGMEGPIHDEEEATRHATLAEEYHHRFSRDRTAPRTDVDEEMYDQLDHLGYL